MFLSSLKDFNSTLHWFFFFFFLNKVKDQDIVQIIICIRNGLSTQDYIMFKRIPVGGKIWIISV